MVGIFDSIDLIIAPNAEPAHIQVLRPQLPTSQEILPYLRRLDNARVYANFGPLVGEFENRLASKLRVGAVRVVTTSSGTAGIMAAVLASKSPTKRRPYALLPSFTFTATALAVERCRFKIYFADVDPQTWALDPDALLNHPALDRIGLVVPVAPFGRPIAQAAWLKFREQTGIPVVIDAAASFFCIEKTAARFIGEIPTVFSFHATKSFGIGEGGCVVSTDNDLAQRIQQVTNFGFLDSRESQVTGFNGKLSEYHAAVGLARLDSWPSHRATLLNQSAIYEALFAAGGRAGSFFGAPEVDGNYALFFSDTVQQAKQIQRCLESDNIDFRYWYGSGVHLHRAFSGAARDDMSVTENIGARIIGLPMAPDLSQWEMERVARAVEAGWSEVLQAVRPKAPSKKLQRIG
jgi:dTDP-4-amino-4,6-dideoxygalactose transaminase